MVHIVFRERMKEMVGFGFGFDLFQIMFFIMFALFAVIFIGTIVKGVGEWNKNNHSPKLTVPVTVVAKRMNVNRHHHGGEHHHTTTSTDYYVTFQVESGDRMELHMNGAQYGLIVEGDRGMLTFQGTRFLDFQRQY